MLQPASVVTDEREEAAGARSGPTQRSPVEVPDQAQAERARVRLDGMKRVRAPYADRSTALTRALAGFAGLASSFSSLVISVR